MPDRNRRFLLRERPSGRIGPNTLELCEEAVPEISDGEALVRVDWISLDPTNRMWINDTPTYLPPVGIGEIAGLITQGKLTPLETFIEGFEQLPTAINMLFDGENVGKLMVKTSG